MKQDFLKSLGLDDDTIAKIQAESGRDITAEKEKTRAAEAIRDSFEAKIKELEETKGDNQTKKDLEAKIAELQGTIDAQKADDEKARQRAELTRRFDAAADTKEFANDYTKSGLLDEFSKALEAEENKGKSDADVFAALTKDREGIFKNPNPSADIEGFAPDVGGGDPGKGGTFADIIQKLQRK